MNSDVISFSYNSPKKTTNIYQNELNSKLISIKEDTFELDKNFYNSPILKNKKLNFYNNDIFNAPKKSKCWFDGNPIDEDILNSVSKKYISFTSDNSNIKKKLNFTLNENLSEKNINIDNFKLNLMLNRKFGDLNPTNEKEKDDFSNDKENSFYSTNCKTKAKHTYSNKYIAKKNNILEKGYFKYSQSLFREKMKEAEIENNKNNPFILKSEEIISKMDDTLMKVNTILSSR